MYGYELAEALDRASSGALAMGHSSLYPLLYNLESKGLIAPRTERAESGRVRKYYRLTPEGRRWLGRHEQEWSCLVDAMARLGLT